MSARSESLLSVDRLARAADSIRFGRYELNLDERRLLVDGEPASLGARALDVLRVLVERSDRPVPKSELLDAVWPEQDVEEGNLPVHISALRKVLGPQAIATVPGCGYRFTLPLQPFGDAAAMARVAPSDRAGTDPGQVLAQAGAAGLPASDTVRTNLLAQWPALIGRDADLAQLRPLLAAAPLLSLVGTSGIGKTRLARELAREQLAGLAGGVWWVDLADLRDGEELLTRVALCLGIGLNRAPDPLEALIKGLARQQLLIVLDNCEHLVAEVAKLVAAVLAVVPGVRWLVTSQEPLKLPLEQVYRLEALAVPSPGTALEVAVGYGALALLVDRARAVDRRFELGPDQVALAIDICAQLDGIALAIEMAAARLPWLGLAGVQARLGERLRLLSADRRGASPRHQTLLAALDWSHALLSPLEQAVFRRLAVFQGGFTLDLAESVVCAAGPGLGISAWEALDALGALVDKSLLQVEWRGRTPGTRGDAPRYRLLESTRLFARQKLEEAGETLSITTRHAGALADWARGAEQQVWQSPDVEWLPQCEPEIDNLRAALACAVAQRRSDWVVPLYEVMSWLNTLLGGGTEVRRWVSTLENLLPDATPALAGRLMLMMGATFRNSAPPRAQEWFARAEQQARLAHDEVTLFRTLVGQGIALSRLQRFDEARARLGEAQQRLDPRWPARLRMYEAETAGMLAACSGEQELACQHYRRYRQVVLEAGAVGGLVTVSLNLADLALAMGRAEEAARIGREHVAWLRTQRNHYALGWALGNLSAALVWTGEWDAAEEAGREALPLMRFEEYAAWLFDHFALLAAHQGDLPRAARLVGYADTAREVTRSVREPAEIQSREAALQLLTQGLPSHELTHWLAQGARLSDAQADQQAFSPARQEGGVATPIG